MATKDRYRQQIAKRYVVVCDRCGRQFAIRTRTGSVEAACPHCGQFNTRRQRLN